MMDALMGIDVGTSSCKLTVFRKDGTVILTDTRKYPVYYPQDGWVEQDPEEWWECICAAASKMMADDKMKEVNIKGIGIDGQGWSMIPIDKEGRVLCRNPIWMDTRAADLCEEYKRKIGEEKIFEISGNSLEPSYTLPKILWLRENRPEIFEKIDVVLQANSFVVFKLTGKRTQDISQGYGLQCFDMRKGTWNHELCSQFGVPERILPSIYNSDEIVGCVTEEAAKLTGLKAGTPVVAGGLDAACGALGAGVIAHGETQEQGGQAEGMSICLKEYIADPRLIMGYHVVPGHWLLQGGTVGGGGVVDWVKDTYCYEEKRNAQIRGTNTYYEMDELSKAIPAGADGVIFLPYMKGERSPIWNAAAKGVYYGIDFEKKRGHLIRASQEGVAYSLRHNLEIAEQAGAQVTELWGMGGCANSQVFMQIKADVTGKVIRVPRSDMATTLGAAILAGIGTGVYQDYEDARNATNKVQKVYSPNAAVKKVYDEGYAKYLRLYEQLECLMTREEVQA